MLSGFVSGFLLVGRIVDLAFIFFKNNTLTNPFQAIVLLPAILSAPLNELGIDFR